MYVQYVSWLDDLIKKADTTFSEKGYYVLYIHIKEIRIIIYLFIYHISCIYGGYSVHIRVAKQAGPF